MSINFFKAFSSNGDAPTQILRFLFIKCAMFFFKNVNPAIPEATYLPQAKIYIILVFYLYRRFINYTIKLVSFESQFAYFSVAPYFGYILLFLFHNK